MNPALEQDTIAAVATAPGQGGIGIVRLSGGAAATIGSQLCQRDFTPRHAHYSQFLDADGQVLDSGIVLYFPAPNSFTGEDVVELHGHGGTAVMDLLLSRCCELGARLAQPGEFSQRAFLNDKMDLAQAEAVADLISATTEAGVRSANRSLAGEFSRRIATLMDQLVALRVYVEAAIDFPEEEIDFLAEGQVADRLQQIRNQLASVTDSARQGRLLRDGMKLVIAGRPNAGKSSLLNALSGEESAIVTAIEGTTRDVLREHIQIDGMPLHVVDTAGLRSSEDLVEQEGIKRAWKEMASADHVLLVVDASDPKAAAADTDTLWPELHRELSANIPVTIVHNKSDLTGTEPGSSQQADATVISLSAKTGAGMHLLRDHLKASMGFDADEAHGFIARRRHIDALQRASLCLEDAGVQVENGAGELLAEDLKRCHGVLGEITGAMSADDLLGEIFSSFCIGK
ncbi:MAG: tRNA uridine-5-carboxymethylaminomethyl(34) synthesis GTPase MnmE [Halieaceae bacterium]|nr:tRNA uridine-5-carboxymethylaminomethyl(34) synthesis GTPase MnmE [Halieaceae bacterium]